MEKPEQHRVSADDTEVTMTKESKKTVGSDTSGRNSNDSITGNEQTLAVSDGFS